MHFTAYVVPNQPFHKSDHYMPDFSFETQAGASRGRIICGVDEAGRGPLAGPVVAAAVIINPENIPAGLNDSKVLSHSARERLLNILTKSAEIGIGISEPGEIDRINILWATMALQPPPLLRKSHGTESWRRLILVSRAMDGLDIKAIPRKPTVKPSNT